MSPTSSGSKNKPSMKQAASRSLLATCFIRTHGKVLNEAL
jgi:hypothetical protein